jgi:pentapeptide repeat protein
MPFGACWDCEHYYVLDEAPSRRWRCPRCKQSLRMVPREEALTHLRQGMGHPHPSAPEVSPRRRTGDPYRMMVVTRRFAQKLGVATADLAGQTHPPVVEIRHQHTGEILWFVAGETLRGADLATAELTHADLRGANLHGADLHEACLCGVNLTAANLSGAKMDGALLIGADLTHADLTGAALGGAVLSACDLTGATLDRRFVGTPFYDTHTRWPRSFDPPAAGAKLLTMDAGQRSP